MGRDVFSRCWMIDFVLSEPSSCAMCREMEENGEKWPDTFPSASSLFCILVTVCSSQVSALDLDIMHGTQLSVHTNTHMSLIAVMPWTIPPELPPQLQDARDVL